MALVRIGNYRLGKTLGVGSFSKVKLAEHEPTGKKVAVKILNRHKIRAQQMEEKLKREIKILKMCMHPHIIRLYEVIETSTDVFVITEYSSGGELFDYIVERGRLAEPEARRFFQQIISGVEYCHKHMIAHRDLKPENLLLDEHSNVKIADFGLSNCMLDGCFLKTSCGSPNYAAPEVISGKLYAGPEVDIWSCGVIVYALLCGTLPFDDESIPYLFRKIKGGIYILPSYLSDTSRDIISKMLVTDPLRRINIDEIRRHPWFLQDLPRYLAVPIRVGAHLEHIDEDVLEQVMKRTQFPRDKIVRALRRGRRNHYTVAYHLIRDAQHELDTTLDGAQVVDTQASDCGNVDDDSISPYAGVINPAAIPPFTNASPLNPVPNGPVVSPHAPHESPMITDGGAARVARNAGLVDGVSPASNANTSLSTTSTTPTVSSVDSRRSAPSPRTPGGSKGDGSGMMVQGALGQDTGNSGSVRLLGEREWEVGIRCSQRNAADSMMEIYRALHALQWRWKTPSNQSFQIRALVEKRGLDRPVRLCLQLFKSSSGYQLDVQRVDGELIAYFVACCELKRELGA